MQHCSIGYSPGRVERKGLVMSLSASRIFLAESLCLRTGVLLKTALFRSGEESEENEKAEEGKGILS